MTVKKWYKKPEQNGSVSIDKSSQSLVLISKIIISSCYALKTQMECVDVLKVF